MLPSSPNSMSSAQLRPSCAETVHELANVMTAVLMNLQALDWRLPPYSRLKRPVREIERNAQRGGELLKRLQRQLLPVAPRDGDGASEFCGRERGAGQGATPKHGDGESCEPKCAPGQESIARYGDGEAREPEVCPARQANLPPAADGPPAPGFSVRREVRLTKVCDPCPSAVFPKGDDRDAN